jgi:tetratricopeptide (TPR) repeat protein
MSANRRKNRKIRARPSLAKQSDRRTNPLTDADLPDLREARRLWQHNHFDAALQLFRRAVDQHPRNAVALLDSARAFGARFQVAQAEQWLDRLLELKSNDPVHLHLVAQSLRMIFRPERAMPLLERVVAQTDSIPDAFLELALLYERRHRLAEAAELIERALRAAPEYLEPRLVQARLHRRQQQENLAESVLRDLTRRPGADPLLKAQAWADLAEMYDRRGEFDAAMTAIVQCKNIQFGQEALVKRLSDQLISSFRGLVDQVRPDDFTRWREHVTARPGAERRVALLAGFPRSGTTLLEQVLDAHPDVVSSEELEVFPRDVFPRLWRRDPAEQAAPTVEALSALPVELWLALRAQYLDTMEQVLGQPIAGRIHLDKNPAMTLLVPAFRRLFPESTVLIALRDPRDVVLSCFLRYLPLNTNSVWYLTLRRTAERYATDMRAWLTLREKLPQPWLQVRYEDLVQNLEGEARRCLQALGLPWDPSVMHYRENMTGKAVRSPTYEAVSRPLFKTAIGRWQNYAKYFEPVLPVLEPFVREFEYS